MIPPSSESTAVTSHTLFQGDSFMRQYYTKSQDLMLEMVAYKCDMVCGSNILVIYIEYYQKAVITKLRHTLAESTIDMSDSCTYTGTHPIARGRFVKQLDCTTSLVNSRR